MPIPRMVPDAYPPNPFVTSHSLSRSDCGSVLLSPERSRSIQLSSMRQVIQVFRMKNYGCFALDMPVVSGLDRRGAPTAVPWVLAGPINDPTGVFRRG